MSRYILEKELLDGYLIGISNHPDRYLIDRLLPPVPGPAKGTIATDDDIEHYGGDPDVIPERLPGDDIPVGTVATPGTVSYAVRNFGKVYPLPVEDERRSQLPLPLMRRRQKKAVHNVKVWQDRILYEAMNNPAWVYKPGAVDAGDRWTASTGDPIEQINAAIEALDVDQGLTMVLDHAAAQALAINATVRTNLRIDSDRLHVTLERFADAYATPRGISRIEVLSTRYNTSKNPDARALSRIATGGWCWIGLLSDSTDSSIVDTDMFMSPTAIARVRERGTGWETHLWYSDEKKSHMVGAGVYEAILPVDTNLGALMTGLAP